MGPSHDSPRRPGRPPAGGVDQRQRLLDAALESFAERGIAATSLRGLARDNGLTPAMLNYYFGSRERLVDAVVEERLIPVIEEQRARLPKQTDVDGVELVRAFVSGLYETIERHPWLPRLWVREVLSDSGQLRGVFVDRIAPTLPRPMAEILTAARARGDINANIEPRLLFVSLIGLTMVPFAAEPIWRRVFPSEDIDVPRMLAHTLALLTEGIKP